MNITCMYVLMYPSDTHRGVIRISGSVHCYDIIHTMC